MYCATWVPESNSFLTGAETGDYIRSLVLELQVSSHKFSDLEREFVKQKLLCLTDAKSLESTLTKDAGQPADKRVRILAAQIHERIGGNRFESDEPAYAQWLDTSHLLADVLTKTGCEREPLLSALLMASGDLSQLKMQRPRRLASELRDMQKSIWQLRTGVNFKDYA